MGNREALIQGAKQAIRDRGYARSTVRDITAAAGGVSMAAIGYHFGSREALLNAALMELLAEWGEQVGAAFAAGSPSDEDDPAASYAATWDRMLATFLEERQMMVASVEAFIVSEQQPELRQQLADGNEEARRGLAAWLTGTREEELDEATVRGIGSIHTALISGLLLQTLVDPERAPTGADVVQGLRALVAAFSGEPENATRVAPEPATRRPGMKRA
jgi:AcrR family transcriptional regulator